MRSFIIIIGSSLSIIFILAILNQVTATLHLRHLVFADLFGLSTPIFYTFFVIPITVITAGFLTRSDPSKRFIIYPVLAGLLSYAIAFSLLSMEESRLVFAIFFIPMVIGIAVGTIISSLLFKGRIIFL